MNIKIYLCTLVCAVALLSCQKDDNIVKSDQNASKIDGNYLSFKDRNAFEVAINSKNLSKFRTANFKSLKETKSDLGIDSDFLQSVLSPEGEIQIGEWLFKLNGIDKTVKVLDPATKAITGNFTFDDDVLDLLENGITSTLAANQRVQLFCGQSGVSQGWNDYGWTNYWTESYTTSVGTITETGQGFVLVNYNKAGIYFELKLHTGSTFPDTKLQRYKRREYWFKPKCKDERYLNDEGWVNIDDDKLNPNATEGYWDKDKIYGSTTALNKYRVILSATFNNGQVAAVDSNHGY